MDTKAESTTNMPSVSDSLKSSRLTIASVNADIGCVHRAFLDSSGRARTRIGVKIHNDDDDDDDGNNESLKHVLDQWRRNLSFEASVSQSSVTVAVEGIRIVSCTCSEDEADGYLCILEIVMRVVNDLVTSVLARNMHKGVINVTFHLSALFVVCGSSGKSDEEEKTFVDPLAELRRETSMIFASSSERDDAVSNYSVGAVVRTKYTSLSIQLMEAFKVTCHSIPASRAAWGATLISVTISHPNTHSHKVVISGISLHPGHARPVVFRNQKQIETSEQMMEYARSITLPAEISGDNRCMQGGNGVINMTGHVRWCYAAGTALDLPLTLETNEAYSTILQVDATDDVNSRYFMSPVAVTGTVLFEKSNCESSQQKQSLPLIVSTYASWTTSRVAVSPSNAFRVDLTLFEKSFRVGTPFTLIIKVFNLSSENKNVMLLINNSKTVVSDKSLAISEIGGYSFGVKGLTDGDNVAWAKDDNILSIDAARLLGDIPSQQTNEADLRFVPLREGTLDIPNFQLYDMNDGYFYDCAHSLKVIADPRM